MMLNGTQAGDQQGLSQVLETMNIYTLAVFVSIVYATTSFFHQYHKTEGVHQPVPWETFLSP